MEIEDLVHEIMTSTKPFPPFSVQCAFDEGSDEVRTTHDVFDFFMTMVCHAFRIRFGNDKGYVAFDDITPDGIYDMQERFKCLGFTFLLRQLEPDEIPEVPGTRVLYDAEDISKCKLILWNHTSETPSAYLVKYIECSPAN